jgi:hypothetical protein
MPSQRAPSLSDALKAIIAWWRGDKPTQRERQIEEAMVERLAAEIEAETETDLKPLKPKRERRR